MHKSKKWKEKSMATLAQMLTLLACIFFAASTPAFADEPPSPLRPHFTQCSSKGPVTLCRYQSEGASAMLRVYYNGGLYYGENEALSVWLKINGRYGVYRMTPSGSYAVATLTNGALNCALCSVDESSSLACPFFYESEMRWICTDAPREMKDMFFWALSPYGKLNAWDVELAFVSGQQWDSLYGRNYRFRFE